ncbi:porphobilinogen deaminase [Penicillium macrosclerotiorum]|uniref:porphobilinogen deaminase n=1 Tax=Penicillium macrosclerotiorum TaxID=303699 RepID=UPI00254799BF|nr:porphobilinogen deaminase [Penicillium macrosclerotiorum]KAJ5683109.1 porphobilinogen deaminase [Penicillium macrosclerotiorum]
MTNKDPALKSELVIGTRNSKLAVVQAERVSQALADAHPQIKFPWQPIVVRGDADKTTPFLKFGGPSDAAKNIWTEEMETKLYAGELDLLVHCLKDMPTNLPSKCILGAIVHREDPTDALVIKDSLREQYTDLAQLPRGAVVGTSSTRRKALIKSKYPYLIVEECRGNLDTRLRKLDDLEGPYSAIIVATAGLNRINLSHRITKTLSASEFPYAVGQGALGIEVRADESSTLGVVRKIEELPTRWICLAERAMLRTLQGGCSSPVAVNCIIENQGEIPEAGLRLRLEGTIIHPHGLSKVSASAVLNVSSDTEAEALGATVAKRLEDNGGRTLLNEINILQKNALEKATGA